MEAAKLQDWNLVILTLRVTLSLQNDSQLRIQVRMEFEPSLDTKHRADNVLQHKALDDVAARRTLVEQVLGVGGSKI